jgi:D-tagatose-1,6-bisphosphate aldolase subunit GatZ/KbaZ
VSKKVAMAKSPLSDMVRRHKAGEHTGITSVCSAHPIVLEAAIAHAAHTGRAVLIEATSNQVDQTGGYTRMRPADFRQLVLDLADRFELPHERVVLGGDHLGPNRWRALPPDQAMAMADDLVRAYVAAGFSKIHLDCSFSCDGDPTPLTDELVAARTARLVAVAEQAVTERDDGPALRYVIGTEVPVPGGAHEKLHQLTPTTTAAAQETLRAHREAFEAARVDHVWPQVMALVVQPGVEFDHEQVISFIPESASELSTVLDNEPDMVFEAHSTDYQGEAALTQMVARHWAVLKVGPQLTFALREALFALAAVEEELLPPEACSQLREVLEEQMLAEPGDWEGYYHGSPIQQRVLRRYSYSDRLRYYWPNPSVQHSQDVLLANLTSIAIPLTLLSQYLPQQYERVRDGLLTNSARELVLDHVTNVLRHYDRACSPDAQTQQSRP